MYKKIIMKDNLRQGWQELVHKDGAGKATYLQDHLIFGLIAFYRRLKHIFGNSLTLTKSNF